MSPSQRAYRNIFQETVDHSPQYMTIKEETLPLDTMELSLGPHKMEEVIKEAFKDTVTSLPEALNLNKEDQNTMNKLDEASSTLDQPKFRAFDSMISLLNKCIEGIAGDEVPVISYKVKKRDRAQKQSDLSLLQYYTSASEESRRFTIDP